MQIHESVRSESFLAPKSVQLLDVIRESSDTVSLVIEAPQAYGQWYPGQFNMVYVLGRGEAAISISGEEKLGNSRTALIHTIKGVGPLTKTMTAWRTSEEAHGVLFLRGPFGSHWPDVAPYQDVLLIGGGIGLAPLRPFIRSYLAEATRRRMLVLYGMKRPEEALYRDEWQTWHAAWDVHFVLSVDRPSPGWEGEVGHVTQLIPRLDLDSNTTLAMICGPEIMMHAAAMELAKLGVPDTQIFVSMERQMKCAIGICGKCQWGPFFVCREGPVFRLSDVRTFWNIEEF